MGIIENATAQFPETSPNQWREVNGAAVHRDVEIGPHAIIAGPAVIRSGTIRGGTIWGGTIRGGTIEGGTIRGGTIEGGTIWGGTIYGGTIWGGTIWGGMIWGGTIRGGTIEGGTIEGGTIWGGTIYGGTIRGDPLFICGLLPHPLNISGPGMVTIGCTTHIITEWEENLETLAQENNVAIDTAKSCLAIVKQWFVDNPTVVREATESEGV